jgi:hypothetical protein
MCTRSLAAVVAGRAWAWGSPAGPGLDTPSEARTLARPHGNHRSSLLESGPCRQLPSISVADLNLCAAIDRVNNVAFQQRNFHSNAKCTSISSY